jgi:hypothetical protein
VNVQLATVLVLLFGVLLGAAGFHVVVMLGLRAIGMTRVLAHLARRCPQEYVDNCPECQHAWETRCTCTELVHQFADDGSVVTGHQPDCPRVGETFPPVFDDD